MNPPLTQQPLAQSSLEASMADIKLPSDPSWWPPAIGWWVLLLTCLVIFVWFLSKLHTFIKKRIRYSEFKKNIELEFLHIEKALNQSVNAESLTKANQLLRRLSIFVANNNNAKALTGTAWLEHLDTLSNSTAYTTGIGQIFSEFPYMQEQQITQQNPSSEAINRLIKKTMDQTLSNDLSFSGLFRND